MKQRVSLQRSKATSNSGGPAVPDPFASMSAMGLYSPSKQPGLTGAQVGRETTCDEEGREHSVSGRFTAGCCVADASTEYLQHLEHFGHVTVLHGYPQARLRCLLVCVLTECCCV